MIAQFEHVAENRNSPSLVRDRRRPKQIECRRHRSRIGIVALVDEDHLTLRMFERHLFATSRLGPECSKRVGCLVDIGTGKKSRTQRGKGILRDVATRRTDCQVMKLAVDFYPGAASVRLTFKLRQFERGVPVCAKTMNVLHACRGCRGYKPLPLAVVAIDDCVATPNQPLENLRLGIGNFVEVLELAEMGGGDQRDDRDVGRTNLTSGLISPG